MVEDVDNFWATHGNASPIFSFAGHTDVVPAGDDEAWKTPPFEPTVKDGLLFGRGAADMKGGLASMLVATENFIEKNPNHKGTLAFLITSDEEGSPFMGKNHRKSIIKTFKKEKIDFFIGVDSPDCKLGEMIKIGRRGSITGELTIIGTQGHVAYPHNAMNPILRL